MAFGKRILLFVLTNILVIATVSIVMKLFGIPMYYRYTGNELNYEALMMMCLVWGMVGSFISLAMSKFMAKWMMGVKIIDPNNHQDELREVVQMVHGLARKAGLPNPEVGYYESDEVNAFATGPTKKRSLVAVSTGLLQKMNRNELEGVLAHEIAHIANGDMVTMTLIQGIINAFVMFFARVVAFFITQNMKEGTRFIAEFAIIIVLQIIFGLLGSIVVNFFSRWREYRADAGGAKLAGRSNMTAALTALMGTQELIDNQHKAMATMKISGQQTSLMAFLFSSHPPLEDRIRRLQDRG